MVGPFEIGALLGAGGMGEVYRALDTALGREVAVKILHADTLHDPDRLHRFRKEAQSAASLNHPNILAIYSVSEHEAYPLSSLSCWKERICANAFAESAFRCASAWI